MKNKPSPIRRTREDRIFILIDQLLVLFVFIAVFYPLWYILVMSFDGDIYNTALRLLPSKWSLNGYKAVFNYSRVWTGYRNSVLYMVLGTALNMVVTICAAYPLSRKDLRFRRSISLLFVFTMYFSGGLIPLYLQVKNLGLYNSPLAMIVPSAISIYNVLILRSFFMYGVPKSLEEAALLDGANTAQMLWRVILPLVKPTLAVLVLYYAIGHWNDYFSALIFLKDKELMPLQTILRDVLITGKIDMASSGMEMEAVIQKLKTAQTLKYSVIVVSTVPLMLVYPFIQKYFVKGIMLGAVKG